MHRCTCVTCDSRRTSAQRLIVPRLQALRKRAGEVPWLVQHARRRCTGAHALRDAWNAPYTHPHGTGTGAGTQLSAWPWKWHLPHVTGVNSTARACVLFVHKSAASGAAALDASIPVQAAAAAPSTKAPACHPSMRATVEPPPGDAAALRLETAESIGSARPGSKSRRTSRRANAGWSSTGGTSTAAAPSRAAAHERRAARPSPAAAARGGRAVRLSPGAAHEKRAASPSPAAAAHETRAFRRRWARSRWRACISP